MNDRRYGTLTNGVLAFAPRVLTGAHGESIITGGEDAAIYLEHGYKRVVETVQPTEAGYTYTPGWTEDATSITQTWTGTAVEPVADPDVLRDAQIQALSDRSDFVEDCIAEMAAVIYA